MNPDWDGIMRSKAREPKPPAGVGDVRGISFGETPSQHLRNAATILVMAAKELPSRSECEAVWDRVVLAIEQLEGKPFTMSNPYRPR
jgi:hypothetical protein